MLKLNTGGRPRLMRVTQNDGVQEGVYGMGRIVQLDSTHAAVIANVRVVESDAVDFEDGSDAIIFDSLKRFDPSQATILSTNESVVVAGSSQPVTLVKYPANVAFIPADAKHPGAGTGFALALAIGE